MINGHVSDSSVNQSAVNNKSAANNSRPGKPSPDSVHPSVPVVSDHSKKDHPKEDVSAKRRRGGAPGLHRQHRLSEDTHDHCQRCRVPVPRWVLLLLCLLPVIVTAAAALIVFGIIPLVAASQHQSHAHDSEHDAAVFVPLLAGVIVGGVLLVVLLVGGVVACARLRRSANVSEDGLLDHIAVRDGIVTLTKLHDERGEYRIDLCSGELNTSLDVSEEDYIASLTEKRESTEQGIEVNAVSGRHILSDSQTVDVALRRTLNSGDDFGDKRRSSVRSNSYKRAVEGRSIYEYKNRPESTLFDVNKFIGDKKYPHIGALDTRGRLSRVSRNGEGESSGSSGGCSPTTPKETSPNIEATSSSVLVNAGTEATQSYGSLGRSKLLSSVDDEGYHFDNIGYSEDNSEDPQVESRRDSINFNQTDDAFDDSILEAVDRLEKDLQKSPHFGVLDSASSCTNTPGGSLSTSDVPLRSKPSDSILTKQDSFQGLPYQGNFDKFLSLVRLDSTTSLLAPVAEESSENISNGDHSSEEATASSVPDLKRSSVGEVREKETPDSKRRGIVFEAEAIPSEK